MNQQAMYGIWGQSPSWPMLEIGLGGIAVIGDQTFWTQTAIAPEISSVSKKYNRQIVEYMLTSADDQSAKILYSASL